jgi:hypothetical protein
VLWRGLERSDAYRHMQDPEYMQDLSVDGLHTLMIAAGCSEEEAQKAMAAKVKAEQRRKQLQDAEGGA